MRKLSSYKDRRHGTLIHKKPMDMENSKFSDSNNEPVIQEEHTQQELINPKIRLGLDDTIKNEEVYFETETTKETEEKTKKKTETTRKKNFNSTNNKNDKRARSHERTKRSKT